MLPTFDAVTEILKVTANEILKANQDESRAQGLTRAKSQKQVRSKFEPDDLLYESYGMTFQ